MSSNANVIKSRRSFLKMAAAGSCAAFLPVSLPNTAFGKSQQKTNIIILMADDLGYGDIGCFGNEIIKTPNLDKLAAQGVRFTDCYSAGCVCSPSRAAMLTGRNPNRLGVYDWISDAPGSNFMYLKKEETTIAELLKQAGYSTFVAGKWHCNGMFNKPGQPQPNDHGFDHWFVTGQNLKRQLNPYEFVRNGKKIETTEGYACEVVADETIRWTNELREKDKPFFQCVWFHEPHEPIASPPDVVAEYADYKGTKPLYYANVTNMDKQIGRILDNLEKQGLAENTFVFFTSDNGPAKLAKKGYRSRSHGSAGPFREYKWTLFEGGIRVPGIIRWPGKVAQATTSDEPVSGVDVLPTLCKIADIPLPQGRTLDGIDISPVFDNKPLKRTIPLHWHYQSPYAGPLAVMRQGDWIVTAQWDIDHPVMGRMKKQHVDLLKKANLKDFKLYNIKMDKSQQTDVGKKYPDKLAALSKQLLRLHKEVQAEAPVW